MEVFRTIRDVMLDLVELRKELLSPALTSERQHDVKAQIVSKIDWGNKCVPSNCHSQI